MLFKEIYLSLEVIDGRRMVGVGHIDKVRERRVFNIVAPGDDSGHADIAGVCAYGAVQEIEFALDAQVDNAAQEGTDHRSRNLVSGCDRLAHIAENAEGHHAHRGYYLNRRVEADVADYLLAGLAQLAHALAPVRVDLVCPGKPFSCSYYHFNLPV